MAAEKPRAVHHVGASLTDERNQLRKLLRRVLEIGVLNDDEIAGRFLKTAPEGRPLSPGRWLKDQLERQLLREPRQDVPRPIPRPVVDDNEFGLDGYGQNPPDDFLDRVPLVVGGHDHRQQWIRELPSQPGHLRGGFPVAVRVRLTPTPGGADDDVDLLEFRSPTQLAAYAIARCKEHGGIAGTPRRHRI